MAESPTYERVPGGWVERRRDHVTTLRCATCGAPFDVPDIPHVGPIRHREWVTPHIDPVARTAYPAVTTTYHYARAEVALWQDGPDSMPRRVWRVVP